MVARIAGNRRVQKAHAFWGNMLRGFGNCRGAGRGGTGGAGGRKWASGPTHAQWAPAPPLLRFPPLVVLLHRPPEVHHPAWAGRAATPCGRPRPSPAPPPAPAPSAGGGAGLLCWSRWFRGSTLGAQSRSLRRRPGYDRGSPASRSGQPESLFQPVPLVERSPQHGPTAPSAAAPPARPLL